MCKTRIYGSPPFPFPYLNGNFPLKRFFYSSLNWAIKTPLIFMATFVTGNMKLLPLGENGYVHRL